MSLKRLRRKIKQAAANAGPTTEAPREASAEADPALPAPLRRLARSARHRFAAHPDAEDVLPPEDTDLAPLARRLVERDPAYTGPLPRAEFANQKRNLQNAMVGKPELTLLHALTISYLRRDTPHTAKASALFHRIWDEQAAVMLEHLNPRWCVSTLQTFFDHGRTEAQRTIGGMGFTYGNLIKVYESERSLYDLPDPDPARPLDNRSIRGMWAFTPGDDILWNINLAIMAAAQSDPVAGPVLIRLLEMTARGNTAFQRLDALGEVPPGSARKRFYRSFQGPR